jgi:hypothetical protein
MRRGRLPPCLAWLPRSPTPLDGLLHYIAPVPWLEKDTDDAHEGVNMVKRGHEAPGQRRPCILSPLLTQVFSIKAK